ncbi:YbaK/EbsC family protein [Thermofilum pendens]|uniref:YbaK/EbsC family protein n=1 Tax=Thermofilum pendens TaxID=2269 RepID=UPI001650B5B3|nr:YbaK/EbsC family protein [Thermofilum pendens]
MLGAKDLESFLSSAGLRFEIVEVSRAATSLEASESLGVGLDRIAKTVVFKSDGGETVLVVVRADLKVDQSRLARLLGYRRLRLARREEVVEETGYEPGGVPPVGHRKRLKVYVDSRLLDAGEVYAGGGDERHLVRLDLRELVEKGFAAAVEVPVKQA